MRNDQPVSQTCSVWFFPDLLGEIVDLWPSLFHTSSKTPNWVFLQRSVVLHSSLSLCLLTSPCVCLAHIQTYSRSISCSLTLTVCWRLSLTHTLSGCLVLIVPSISRPLSLNIHNTYLLYTVCGLYIDSLPPSHTGTLSLSLSHPLSLSLSYEELVTHSTGCPFTPVNKRAVLRLQHYATCSGEHGSALAL